MTRTFFFSLHPAVSFFAKVGQVGKSKFSVGSFHFGRGISGSFGKFRVEMWVVGCNLKIQGQVHAREQVTGVVFGVLIDSRDKGAFIKRGAISLGRV